MYSEATLSPENLENTSNFAEWGLTLVAYKKMYTKFLSFKSTTFNINQIGSSLADCSLK